MVWLVPALIRQLERILTAGWVRNGCMTPLCVKGNLTPTPIPRAAERLCVLSVSVTELFSP